MTLGISEISYSVEAYWHLAEESRNSEQPTLQYLRLALQNGMMILLRTRQRVWPLTALISLRTKLLYP